MCRNSLTFLFSLLLSCPCWAEALFKTENIYPLTDKHAHSSSIVECPDGSLLACWFYGSGERTAADVVVYFSAETHRKGSLFSNVNCIYLR